MVDRITRIEATVYRHCHHEFGGKTVADTATILSMSESTVRRLLKSLKTKAPQLFPILNRNEFAIYKMVTEQGLTQEQIAILFNTTQSSIQGVTQNLKDRGMLGLDVQGLGKTVSYDSSMDKHVKQKF